MPSRTKGTTYIFNSYLSSLHPTSHNHHHLCPTLSVSYPCFPAKQTSGRQRRRLFPVAMHYVSSGFSLPRRYDETKKNNRHYTTLHYITLHYTTLHYITLHYTTLHYTTIRYTTLYYTSLHHATLHYNTLRYTTLRYTTLHYTAGCYLTLKSPN